RLSDSEIRELATEIRQFLVETVSRTGGHLAPNLGVVELTIAIHLALDMPRDKVVWDVGHQSYVHKLLTGRRGAFLSLRQEGGISGFPRREESVYDSFGTGHSSTSISAALGMALARDISGDRDYACVAVIGDGALAGGMAFEAMNDAGHIGTDLIVILNDNEMSISRSVGALAGYLGNLRTDPRVQRLKGGLEHVLTRVPLVGQPLARLADNVKKGVKSLVVPGMLFEELGFMYIGPIDGHNIRAVKRAIEHAKRVGGPVLVHAVTRKGKGYAPAEADPSRFHGTAPFDVRTGKPVGEDVRTFTSYFGEFMVRAAEVNPKVVGITAAMKDGTGLSEFARVCAGRFFDVGIAEQHAVTLAAGLASQGMRPVVAVYSTFLQRAYDQVVHDVALQRIPVMLALDRAGIVGEDGYTHQGSFDVALLRHVPNMVLMAPKDEAELMRMLHTGLELDSPCAVRYPRSEARGVPVAFPLEPLEVGRGEVLREGGDCAIFALGPMVWPALEAARLLSGRGISCAVVNARFVKPLDTDLLLRVAESTGTVLTVEDACLPGGFGSAVLEALAEAGMSDVALSRLGIPDRFVEHGTRQEILSKIGLDARGIASAVQGMLASRSTGGGKYASQG
ncbi:MAG: 1-deoxy-D-xylulose-5-phosphate synthase, partial [Firmicutes bacterium]|nr:1-deoxy-D-xylulose-5-phosphate synthase [Bacillota bacterium]